MNSHDLLLTVQILSDLRKGVRDGSVTTIETLADLTQCLNLLKNML